MDSIFLLGETDRAAFLQHTIRTFGCTYCCLWSYVPPPSKCLLFSNGVYREESSVEQASSSSGTSLARTLFDAYCESIFYVDHGRVPGFAFKNHLPYLEIKLDGLGRLASSDVQMQFYQEAGIQTVVFMGCTLGEVELGIMSSEPQVNLEKEIKNWLQVNFSIQLATPSNIQNTSPSSLRSLSLLPSISDIITSPNYLVANEQGPREPLFLEEALLEEKLRFETLNQMRKVGLPKLENEHDAMTKAILSVLTSSLSSSSSGMVHNSVPLIISPREPSGFRSYHSALGPVGLVTTGRRQNMFKRSVLFFRELNTRRRWVLGIEERGPTDKHLHHVIAEKRRRENVRQSFQVLRSMLPPGSKKDNATVLSMITEFIDSLKTQVEQLEKRNQTLETHLSANVLEESEDRGTNVKIVQISQSTTESRFLDLRVWLRSRECSSSDLMIRVLGFLRQLKNVSLVSVQYSNTSMEVPNSMHGLLLRLKIERDEFDESSFQEAVKRVVDGLPR
ncbi:basic helix-loop-helix (bHLH) DNA-binding family protein [Striga asiatica]|uniref:Basic helix-loop-helix (BHLH) DNA-binding family protein n=1 Tax=Striga asiatica TaxID=4170 RepID=A0A5A7PWS3_STRAF|nr:basic helix-loop-helix (bHLH) DNA-binding family protein [Striga asiatica]